MGAWTMFSTYRHRLSTMEVESALVAHEKVAEAAVLAGLTNQGQAISAFVSLEHVSSDDGFEGRAEEMVAKEIGCWPSPMTSFTDTLPKTAAKDHARC